MLQIKGNDTYWGRGAYTAPEAARLTGVPRPRIHRWLEGRSRIYKGEQVFDTPLWLPEFAPIDGTLHLSFRDLVELRVVDRFRAAHLSMPYLRKVVEAAQEILKDTHPFSNTRLKSDGRRVYIEILSATNEPALVEVLSGQHAFHSIVSEGLKDIEFEGGFASYWRPAHGKGQVVVDPRRSMGQPILDDSGLPTSVVKLHATNGRSVREISRDFDVTEKAVRSALAFEISLAA
jgi:uncharacterized protein (DUF433 family)